MNSRKQRCYYSEQSNLDTSMQFSVSANALANALSFVGRVIPSRPTHPILSCVIVKTIADGLSLTGFDLSTGLIQTIEGDVITEGITAIPFKIFNDIVCKLEGTIKITLTSSEETGSTVLGLVTESSQYSISCMNASDYPEMPDCTGDFFTLPTDLLANGLNHVIPFASTDDTKQILTGVHITCKETSLEFASTDGHRLAVFYATTESPLEGFSLTLPSKPLTAIAKMAGEVISISIGELMVKFQCGNSTLICRVLSGSYPAYRQLIPNDFKGMLSVSSRQLQSALDRLGLFADGKNNAIVLKIGESPISVEVASSQVGNGVEKVDVDYPDPTKQYSFTSGLNLKYLSDGLRMIVGQCSLRYNEPSQPIVLKSPTNDFVYLVMPVMVRG